MFGQTAIYLSTRFLNTVCVCLSNNVSYWHTSKSQTGSVNHENTSTICYNLAIISLVKDKVLIFSWVRTQQYASVCCLMHYHQWKLIQLSIILWRIFAYEMAAPFWEYSDQQKLSGSHRSCLLTAYLLQPYLFPAFKHKLITYSKLPLPQRQFSYIMCYIA